MNSVTFRAIEPGCVGPSGDVTAFLEELDRLTVTGPAHIEYRGRIGSGHKVTRVRFILVRLRGVSAVAPVAPDARAAVGAGLKD